MREDLGRLLSGIPRETAPDIPLETLLDRATAARRRGTVLAAVALAGLSAIAIGLNGESKEAPVHLKLHVIEIEAPDPPAAEPTRSPGAPEEFDRP